MIDLPAVLALNQAHERETSALDLPALQALTDKAFHLGLHNRGRDAFLIALDQDADYAGFNFSWFKARYSKFVYVDRIIVAAHARGAGVARTLYEDLFHVALDRGHAIVGCEIYKDPPNPNSDAFHARLGFTLIGEATLPSGDKTVRYMARALG